MTFLKLELGLIKIKDICFSDVSKVEDGVKIGSNATIKNKSIVYNDIDDGETI